MRPTYSDNGWSVLTGPAVSLLLGLQVEVGSSLVLSEVFYKAMKNPPAYVLGTYMCIFGNVEDLKGRELPSFMIPNKTLNVP